MALIDELYGGQEAEYIKAVYHGDEDSRPLLMKTIGSKIIGSDKILVSNALDIVMMVCMNANFAHSAEECTKVAVILHKNIHNDAPLPYFMDGQTLQYAERVFISLTFFAQAMQYRHVRRGAPPPDFYRRTSKVVFTKYDHEDVADNHERWEAFLSEMFFV